MELLGPSSGRFGRKRVEKRGFWGLENGGVSRFWSSGKDALSIHRWTSSHQIPPLNHQTPLEVQKPGSQDLVSASPTFGPCGAAGFFLIHFFSNPPGGVLGGLRGSVWASAGQIGLKSSSIRLQGVFPRRPKSTSSLFFRGPTKFSHVSVPVFLRLAQFWVPGVAGTVSDSLSL